MSAASSFLPFRVASSRASIEQDVGLVGERHCIVQKIHKETIEDGGKVGFNPAAVERRGVKAVLVNRKLGAQLIGKREKRLAWVNPVAVAKAAEMIGGDLGPLVAQPGRQRGLAHAGLASDPQHTVRAGKPFLNLAHDPLAAGEARQVAGQVVAVIHRIEVVQQSLLNGFKWHLLLDQRLYQRRELFAVLFLMLLGGEAVAHVEPLQAADGKRRLDGGDHHRDDGQVAAIGAREFIEAVAIRTAH